MSTDIDITTIEQNVVNLLVADKLKNMFRISRIQNFKSKVIYFG